MAAVEQGDRESDAPPRSPDGARSTALRHLRDLLRVEATDAARAGRAIPDEADLMRRYRLSRDGIRAALALLTAEGVIDRRRGVGTHPRSEPRPLSLAMPPAGRGPTAHSAFHGIEPMLLAWEWIAAPTPVSRRLSGVADGGRCLRIDYLLVHDGRRSGVVTNYLRAAEGERLRKDDFTADFYALLQGDGDPLAGLDFVIQASTADELVADILEVEVGDAILWLEQMIRDRTGDIVDFAIARLSRDVRLDTAAGGRAPDLTSRS